MAGLAGYHQKDCDGGGKFYMPWIAKGEIELVSSELQISESGGFMKTQMILSVLITLFFVSCGAKKTTTVTNPAKESLDRISKMFTKNGHKCTFVGSDGVTKDIFVSRQVKEDATEMSIHDYRESGRISFVGGSTLIGHYFSSITLRALTIDGQEVLQGSSILTLYPAEPLRAGAKVVTVSGRLTLTDDMDGLVEKVVLLLNEDNTTSTEIVEIGRIEACAPADAKWG